MGSVASVAALSVQLAGIVVLLVAGRVEARGALEESRRLARRGGLVAALGGAGALPLLLTGGGASPWTAALAAASGFAALLAGLSGKPRPTGWAAAALHLAAWGVFAAPC